jgi:DNA-binding PadR family transcriptional regulator
MATAKKKTEAPLTQYALIERHLMKYKKIAVGDAEDLYNIGTGSFYPIISKLRKQGYPIKSEWVTNDYNDHFVLYSIPSKWSKKSLNK